MTFAFLPFPYLHSYSLTTQFIILLALISLSYRSIVFRNLLLAVLGLYTIYKISFPLARWGYAAFKGIAMFGFYVHFFILGVGYIASGALAVWRFPELLESFMNGLEGRDRQ
ncbi:hypothetical protein R3P38DRAFT_2540157 [Favolaschia claudopus]|uniref:Uncharacterized protein n=1 Tax=Favolaschia claudopus TaxID=2862362 RepID=A0AAW0AVW9_9AGAR